MGETPKENEFMPTYEWRCKISPGFFYAIGEGLQPNAFHRFTQRIVLGIKWERALRDEPLKREKRAKLMAAAPELLEALENLLKVHEGEGGTQHNAADIARAAIEKAKGVPGFGDGGIAKAKGEE